MAMILFCGFIILVILGFPIAFSLGISSLMCLLINGKIPLMLIAQRLYTGSDSFVLLCIPFFILAGEIMDSGGLSKGLLTFCNSVVGKVRGGLALVSILISMIFAGITGAAAADSSAVGSIVIPTMIDEGYDRDFACAVTGAASTIGVIIPPSIPMVLYGSVTGVSVVALFLGGIIPGILIGVAQMVFAYYISKKRGYPRHESFSIKRVLESLKTSVFALGMPFILIGGILSGVFTPTEAGAVSVFYALIVAGFVYKTFSIKQFPKVLLNTVATTASIMLIVATASLYSWLITYIGVPKALGDFLLSTNLGKISILFSILIIYFLAGCIMDMGANIIMLTPIFYPIITKLGLNPIHFGIITIVILSVGLLTPPVCICTFIVSAIGNVPVEKVARSMIPFMACIVIVAILLIFIPELATFLPSLVGK